MKHGVHFVEMTAAGMRICLCGLFFFMQIT